MLNVNTNTNTITEITEEVQVVQLSTEHFDNLSGAEFFLQRTFGKNFARTWEPSRGAKRYYLPAALYAGYSFESAYRSQRVESGTYLGEAMASGAERASLVLEAVELWLESTPEAGTTLHIKTKPCRTVEEEVTQNLLTVINAVLPQPVVVEEDVVTEEAVAVEEELSQHPIKEITDKRQEFKIGNSVESISVEYAREFAENVVGSAQGGFRDDGVTARYGLLSAPLLEQLGWGLDFVHNYGLQQVTSINGEKVDRDYISTLNDVINSYDFDLEFRLDGTFFVFRRKGGVSLEDKAVDTAFLELINSLYLSFSEVEETTPVVEHDEESSLEIETLMESEGAVRAVCYTTGEVGWFTPQLSKHVYHFEFEGTLSTLEYYLSEETLTGKGGFALLEEYHGNGAYREVVEVENIPTYVQEVFGGTCITEEAYENMKTLIAM